MVILLQAALLLLFLLLAFTAVYSLMLVIYRENKQKSRLRGRRKSQQTLDTAVGRNSKVQQKAVQHISDLLRSVHSSFSVKWFYTLTAVLACLGLSLGILMFQQLKGTLLLTFMLTSLPYLTLRVRLISFQMRRKEEFLPALEVFYQCYVTTMPGNVRNTLHQAVSGGHMTFSMKRMFEQLYRDLMTQNHVDEAFRIFVISLGHTWSKHFAQMLKMSLEEGVDIRDNLKQLITDMRKAEKAALIDRNRLLEIRIASFSPMLFLILFVGINFYLDDQQSYRFYFLDPGGRGMLLDAVWLIFASFVMGIYLSVKRM
ncbi:hypothetical protein [Marinicrinis lubricantis]|uniref:Type II secretion system protein GspF domain-containing protein n=1 Tax=Marinicrinis lubricantis TaxID=2086470 RepID=A0ABW1IJG4_9BACL